MISPLRILVGVAVGCFGIYLVTVFLRWVVTLIEIARGYA